MARIVGSRLRRSPTNPCLLGNHFQLLLFSESGRLSEAMRFLGSRYTQRINYRDGRDGSIFRGRFASVAVARH